jgi:ATP phosphoribosyltransferase
VYGLADFLRQKGAETVSVVEIEYVFALDNPLFEKLKAGLAARG